jgi:thioesterase domain-containing protein
LALRLDLLRRRFLYQQQNIGRKGVSGAVRYLRPKFAALLETTRNRWAERVYALIAGAGVKTSDPRLAIRFAASRYAPPACPGRLDLFRLGEPHVDAYDYPEMGWQGLSQGGIAVHDLAGNHLTMFSEPQAGAIAEWLLKALRPALEERLSVRVMAAP